jgi:hypothetical protein
MLVRCDGRTLEQLPHTLQFCTVRFATVPEDESRRNARRHTPAECKLGFKATLM